MPLLTSHSLVMALRLPARAVSAPPLQPSEGASFASALPLQASTDASFAAWLEAELAQAPGAAVYGDVFADLVQGVVAWRRRYRGNQALWRRLLRPERLIKEIIETAPVIAAVSDYVRAQPPGGDPVTIVDLCCGKGYLSMLLAEMLPSESLRGCVLVDKAWPRHDVQAVGDKHINPEVTLIPSTTQILAVTRTPNPNPTPAPAPTPNPNPNPIPTPQP